MDTSSRGSGTESSAVIQTAVRRKQVGSSYLAQASKPASTTLGPVSQMLADLQTAPAQAETAVKSTSSEAGAHATDLSRNKTPLKRAATERPAEARSSRSSRSPRSPAAVIDSVTPPPLLPLERLPVGILKLFNTGLKPRDDDEVLSTSENQVRDQFSLEAPVNLRYYGDRASDRMLLYDFFREFFFRVRFHFARYRNSEIKTVLRSCLRGPARMKFDDAFAWTLHPRTSLLSIYRFLAQELPDDDLDQPYCKLMRAFQAKGETPRAWLTRLENLALRAHENLSFFIVVFARDHCTNQLLRDALRPAVRALDMKAVEEICFRLTGDEYRGTGRVHEFNIPFNIDEETGEKIYIKGFPLNSVIRQNTDDEDEMLDALDEDSAGEESDDESPPPKRRKTSSTGSKKGCHFCRVHNFSRPETHSEEDCFNKDQSKRRHKSAGKAKDK
ncbi:hypothetical protein BZA70DRAFT_279194 [Myxozyma melibiosi]|uniref:Uncharacterized protein n=1 Tax=Myxozyma melibiosi TaxID=54550 RepID=A0ABR1F5R3_9ASCO